MNNEGSLREQPGQNADAGKNAGSGEMYGKGAVKPVGIESLPANTAESEALAGPDPVQAKARPLHTLEGDSIFNQADIEEMVYHPRTGSK